MPQKVVGNSSKTLHVCGRNVAAADVVAAVAASDVLRGARDCSGDGGGCSIVCGRPCCESERLGLPKCHHHLHYSDEAHTMFLVLSIGRGVAMVAVELQDIFVSLSRVSFSVSNMVIYSLTTDFMLILQSL